jgi:hypothetical protein
MFDKKQSAIEIAMEWLNMAEKGEHVIIRLC